MEAFRDVLGTQARADGAFLDDVHRGGQRTGTQQQRQVAGVLGRTHARDLEAAAQFGLDGGHRQHLALALLEEHHGHGLVDVLAGDFAQVAAAGLVQAHGHGRLLVLVEGGRGVGELLAGEDGLTPQHHRGATPLAEQVGAEGHHTVLAGQGALGLGAHVHQTGFQRGGTAQDVLGTCCVLHAGQLHHDPVGALALDDRLGHAQFVDPVVQRGDVLLHRVVQEGAHGGLGQRQQQLRVIAVAPFLHGQVGLVVTQQLLGAGAGILAGKVQHQLLAVALDAVVAHLAVAQQRAHVGHRTVQALVQRLGGVDLHQEVHTAAQVQTQVHGQGVQLGQPRGRGRQQVQRGDVDRIGRIRVHRLLQHVAGAQLGIGGVEADLDGVVVAQHPRVGDAGLVERGQRLAFGGRVDLDGRLLARYLNRWRFAVEVGEGIDQAEDQRQPDEGISPERISIHTQMALMVPFGRRVWTVDFWKFISMDLSPEAETSTVT